MHINFYPAIAVNNLVGKTATLDKEKMMAQANIIQSELDELKASIKRGDFDGIRDDVQDLIFTVAGQIGISGLTQYTEADWNLVIESQYSKFDYTDDAAAATMALYESRNMKVEQRTVRVPNDVFDKLPAKALEQIQNDTLHAIVTISSVNQIDHRGQDCPEGKWLKSADFEELKFTGTVSSAL